MNRSLNHSIRTIIVCLLMLFYSCDDNRKEKDIETQANPMRETPQPGDTSKVKTSNVNTFSNTRFRKVTVNRMAPDKIRIEGEAQIFEATFGWVIEDGHNELKKGFAETDDGAPAWGAFEFTIDQIKRTDHSTLHIILFEISAKDGSRQHELHIPLKG